MKLSGIRNLLSGLFSSQNTTSITIGNKLVIDRIQIGLLTNESIQVLIKPSSIAKNTDFSKLEMNICNIETLSDPISLEFLGENNGIIKTRVPKSSLVEFSKDNKGPLYKFSIGDAIYNVLWIYYDDGIVFSNLTLIPKISRSKPNAIVLDYIIYITFVIFFVSLNFELHRDCNKFYLERKAEFDSFIQRSVDELQSDSDRIVNAGNAEI